MKGVKQFYLKHKQSIAVRDGSAAVKTPPRKENNMTDLEDTVLSMNSSIKESSAPRVLSVNPQLMAKRRVRPRKHTQENSSAEITGEPPSSTGFSSPSQTTQPAIVQTSGLCSRCTPGKFSH
jgi:hypothetical protein